MELHNKLREYWLFTKGYDAWSSSADGMQWNQEDAEPEYLQGSELSQHVVR
jgi:hypothetical protein